MTWVCKLLVAHSLLAKEGDFIMLIRQPIRNNTQGNKKPRVFDALIDTQDGEVYLELKNAKQKEIIRLCDILSQIELAKRQAYSK